MSFKNVVDRMYGMSFKNIVDMFELKTTELIKIGEIDKETLIRLPQSDSNPLKINWINIIHFVAILFAVVFIIVAWIMLVVTVRKMSLLMMIGTRSQEECGKNYMEHETARNKLYIEYTGQIGTFLKVISNLLITIIGLAFLAFIAHLINNLFTLFSKYKKDSSNMTCEDTFTPNKRLIYILLLGAIILTLTVLYIVYIQQNTQFKFEAKYNDAIKKIPLAGRVSVTTLLSIAFITAIILIIYMNKIIETTMTPLIVWIILLTIAFIFIYMMNINTIKINNQFVLPYGSATKNINENINVLRDLTCNECVVKEGGTKINEWMNRMLSRNIKRVHPEEENGDPATLLDSSQENGYLNTLYAYLEHALGQELKELPSSVTRANDARIEIRKKMRYLRHHNNDMLNPVKSFVSQITSITLIIVAIFTFMLFHFIYQKYPTATTVSMTLISIIIIIIGLTIYTWNKGRNVYV